MFDSARSISTPRTERLRPAVQLFLLGQIDFDHCLALQHRLVREVGSRADGQIALVICEHPPIITIGRAGSRDDVRLASVQLAGRQLDLVHVNRDGGAMLHVPGQLAVYPIVPLDWHGWTVEEFLARFQAGLLSALGQLQIAGQTRPGRFGIWGRSGQLVSLGVAVDEWTTYYGAHVNVNPAIHLFEYIDTDPVEHTSIGSLYAERRRAVMMTSVRSRVARSVAEAFGCPQYHLYTDHPFVSQSRSMISHYRSARIA